MFYDLNLPYIDGDRELSRKLHFLSELGYNVVALNHSITGKLPTELTCLIPDPKLLKAVPARLQVIRRVTLTLTEAIQNARLNALAQLYDVLALRATDEKTLRLALDTHDCDIISMDMSQRFGFHFKLKMFSEAIKLGKRIEICYAQAIQGDSAARRNLISNATQLIRATRGKGIIMSSEAKTALACRGPADVINLAAVWGLPQDRGHEAIAKEARGLVARAQLKRTSYRGVINVVHAGEPAQAIIEQSNGTSRANTPVNGQKRKVDESGLQSEAEKPLSKSQMKKRAKLAARAALAKSSDLPGS